MRSTTSWRHPSGSLRRVSGRVGRRAVSRASLAFPEGLRVASSERSEEHSTRALRSYSEASWRHAIPGI
eukprot:3070447-Alexandrium_andersonii.AAC.1